MKVIIFGASGKIGQQLTKEMLARGHTVTAFVYGPDPFDTLPRLKVIQGDIHNKDDVTAALKNQDAVLSALGSWGTQTKDILSSAMKHIIPLMEKQKIKRIVSLTGADARDLGDRPNIVQKCTHWFFGIIAKPIMSDGEEHIRLLRSSQLDWCVVRSPVMRDTGSFGKYSLSPRLPMPWASIHRKDVVTAMATLVENRSYVKQSPIIASK
jgi:putative NADH-flavin reductase